MRLSTQVGLILIEGVAYNDPTGDAQSGCISSCSSDTGNNGPPCIESDITPNDITGANWVSPANPSKRDLDGS